jgi:hypothetical protein
MLVCHYRCDNALSRRFRDFGRAGAVLPHDDRPGLAYDTNGG